MRKFIFLPPYIFVLLRHETNEFMNKIIYLFVIMAVLTSCAESYSIQGSSSVSSLDGSKLYLKTVKDQELKNMDSCDVVHGKFRFTGLLDTVRLATLYMDEQSTTQAVASQARP